jgi:hypothetical protein
MKLAIILFFFIIPLFLFAGCDNIKEIQENPDLDEIEDEDLVSEIAEPDDLVQEDDNEKIDKLNIDFSVKLEEGIRISDGSVPYAHKTSGGEYRLYYCGEGGILSAISEDGLDFEKEKGVRVSSTEPGTIACDPTIVDLEDGRVRMYYKVASGQGGPGQSVHKIYSAISEDGLDFESEGVRIDSEKTDDRGWASVPEATLLPDGKIRIYYVSDSIESGHGIVSAISEDGLDFEKEKTNLPSGFVDPAITILPDGTYMLLASVLPMSPKGSTETKEEGIYSFVSEEGVSFSDMKPVYISKGAIDPSIIQIDSNEWRIYFWNHNDMPPQIKSIGLVLK